MIQIKNIIKSYGSKEVLKSLSVNIEENKIIGLLGTNGSGKTTLFRCITGMEKYRGEILYKGISHYKEYTSYVPTTNYVYPKITGGEHLQFMLKASNTQIKNIDKWNEIFQLPLSKYAREYSTGMKKRLFLMASFMQKKPIMLLDEPFSGLDLEMVIVVKEILRQMKDNGRIIVLSSHVTQILTDICDEIILLHDGIVQENITQSQFYGIDATIIQHTYKKEINGLIKHV